MKFILSLLTLFALAVLLGTAQAGKGAADHGHEDAHNKSAGSSAHNDAAPRADSAGAIMPHGVAQHMKDMEAFRRAMAANFAGLMGMITGLIYERGEAVVAGARVLASHAEEIAKLRPPKNTERIEEYRYYAFQLEQHSLHFVKSVEEKNHLSEVAGYHLGQVVNACVSCHTIFRPKAAAR
ncbi:MAG: hypothetical protein O7B79_06260 [SAR324 cluster bacterium]|nr:hypothetical protein [SAR324 cluster bacterium]